MSNFVQVTGRPFTIVCVKCQARVVAGDVEIDPRCSEAKKYPVYADTTGEPFKAYYCAECKGAL